MLINYFIYSYGGGPPRFGGNRGGGGGKFGNPGDRLRKKQWNLDELPKFEKNFYQQHPDVARRSMVWNQYGPLQCYTSVVEHFPFAVWLHNQSWPLTFFFLHLVARSGTVQEGQNHYTQGKRLPESYRQVS